MLAQVGFVHVVHDFPLASAPQNVVSKKMVCVRKLESMSQSPLADANMAIGRPQVEGVGVPAVMSAGILERAKK